MKSILPHFLKTTPPQNNLRRRPLIESKVCLAAIPDASDPQIMQAVRHGRNGISWQQAVKTAARETTPVIGCMPAADCLTLWLDAPFTDWQKSRRILPAVLDAQLPFPLEECVYDFSGWRRHENGRLQVLAVAARRSTVEMRLSRYRALGLDPVILDHSGLACWTQSIVELPAAGDFTRCVLYLEARTLTLAIGTSDNFQQAHTFGLPPQSAGPQQSWWDALFGKLERLFQAECGKNWRPYWVLIQAPDLDAASREAWEKNIVARWPGPLARPEAPNLFLARALASRALTAGYWRCNLHSDTLQHPIIRRQNRRRSFRAASLAFAAGILLILGNIFWRASGAAQLAHIQNSIADLAAALAPAARIPYGREIEEARRALDKDRQGLVDLQAAISSPLPQNISRLLAVASESATVYFELKADAEKFSIFGAAADWPHCEELAQKLRANGWQVEIESLPALEDGRAAFNLKGSWH